MVKINQFQALLDVWNPLPEVQKTWHFSIFEAKFIFSDKNTVELMPMMSKLAWNRLFPGNIQSSRKFLEVSRTDRIFEFCIKNQVPWQKLSGKNTQYIEIGQNQPIPGHFWISGCLESRIKKLPDHYKSCLKLTYIEHYFLFFNFFPKNSTFWKFSLEVPKSAVKPRPIIPKSTQLN